jgi:hypothetical protein
MQLYVQIQLPLHLLYIQYNRPLEDLSVYTTLRAVCGSFFDGAGQPHHVHQGADFGPGADNFCEDSWLHSVTIRLFVQTCSLRRVTDPKLPLLACAEEVGEVRLRFELFCTQPTATHGVCRGQQPCDPHPDARELSHSEWGGLVFSQTAYIVLYLILGLATQRQQSVYMCEHVR